MVLGVNEESGSYVYEVLPPSRRSATKAEKLMFAEYWPSYEIRPPDHT